MRKQEFLVALRARLACLPGQDAEEHLNFYSEMIDDRMEEGVSEEDAVAAIGSVERVAAQILANTSIPTLEQATATNQEEKREKKQAADRPADAAGGKRRFQTWEIVLLAVGSPIWFALGIAAFAILLSLYVVLWSVIVSLWSVFVALIACALGGAVAGIGFIIAGGGLVGVFMIGAGILCAGLAILFFFGCGAATQGTVLLTKRIALGLQKLF